MTALDQLIDGTAAQTRNENVTVALRHIATNKDIRIFLTSLCKYSKSDWAKLARACKALYSVLQSTLMISKDSALLNEIERVPHIAAFFRRLKDED